ncbi:MAG: hypothetical protein IJ806_09030 [Ruminococcus sp.]|nr:hypothetical protein [Ruminococcus sp.]
MSQYTLKFIIGYLLWGLLFAVLFGMAVMPLLMKPMVKMVTELDIKYYYLTMLPLSAASAVLNMAVARFVIGRIVDRPCKSYPKNPKRWFIIFAVVNIGYSLYSTVSTLKEYRKSSQAMETLLYDAGKRLSDPKVADFLSKLDGAFPIVAVAGGVICIALTLLLLPWVKEKYGD